MADKAIALMAVGAVVAIGYVLWRQRKDHMDILRLMEERERKRDDYHSKQHH